VRIGYGNRDDELQRGGHRMAVLISASDDGIVVRGLSMTTKEYLDSYETNRPRELRRGVVREPPAPFFSHQQLVLKIARVLADHAEWEACGHVGIAPLDVVLDADRALVVQPDVLFVAAERSSIIRNQIWGAPDLVVEVLSPGSAAHDRGEKLEWYRQYGVRECWLVDPGGPHVTVIEFAAATPTSRVITPPDIVRSSVLRGFVAPASLLLP
jgi:Uma2 family endonuclease